MDYSNCTYVLQNKLDFVEFVAYQDKTDSQKGFVFKKQEKQIVGWDKPLLPKSMKIDLKLTNENQFTAHYETIDLNFEDYNYF